MDSAASGTCQITRPLICMWLHVECREERGAFQLRLSTCHSDECVQQCILLSTRGTFQIQDLERKLKLRRLALRKCTHFLEVGKRGITDENCIIQNESFRWVLWSHYDLEQSLQPLRALRDTSRIPSTIGKIDSPFSQGAQ